MRLEGVNMQTNYMNIVYAFAATVLYSIIAVALLALGDHDTRVVVLMSLVFGVMSQFLAQDGRRFVDSISLILAWLAMVLTVVAVLGFALTNG